ncbi:serine hydrolase [Brevibacillus panacihumi]|uniref:serine hydrolase n=1 Tax=Brevibacillus panacihumi TaxID=497735 RepID=UPI003D1E6F78
MNHLQPPTRKPLGYPFFTALFLAATLFSSAVIPAASAESKPTIQAQATKKPLTPEHAEEFLDAFFADPSTAPHFVGASVVIVQKDRIIAQKGYGYADQEKKTAVDPMNTVFRIASVSKSFTAVAIMQLAEQGKIDLQADIRTYLENIDYQNPFTKPVTVEHLLTHTTGFDIRDPKQEDLHGDFDKVTSMEDYVKQHMPDVLREPGSSYMYDNFAYLLLGLIVQNVSGEPYESYMEKHVFEPLGIHNSGFLLEGDFLKHLAIGYDAANQPIKPYAFTPTIMPHGGMLSTSEDVGKWIIALLNQGKNASGRILSPESVEQMMKYRSAIHPLLPDTTYGFEGAFQIPEAGSSPAVVTKAGDLPGFSSYLILIPEKETGVFLTYNKQGALRNLFYSEFMETFFPEYAAPAKLETGKTSSVGELEKYNGLYQDLRVKSLVTSVKATGQGELTISDALIGPRVLHQAGEGLFIDDMTRQLTAFKLDEKNQTVYIKEPYLNPLGYAKKGETPAGYTDVKADHPYSHYIYSLQSLKIYPNEAGLNFQPQKPVTRGEYVRDLLVASGIKSSSTKDFVFSDIAKHPNAAYIQMAYELGMVEKNQTGMFQPNRVITRQEAAVMIWNVMRLQYPDAFFEDVKLAGKTADWAVPAVKMMVAFGYHGPEVKKQADGAVDFLSAQPLTRQEEAALFYQLYIQPVNQIAEQRKDQ